MATWKKVAIGVGIGVLLFKGPAILRGIKGVLFGTQSPPSSSSKNGTTQSSIPPP